MITVEIRIVAHDDEYEATVKIDGKMLGTVRGRTKTAAILLAHRLRKNKAGEEPLTILPFRP